ncbi:MAG: o-succinylbenzoate synthase, partial [Actinomycetota bacterium]|nr:o-succinylbenzoate synthase [Actinomycetota bacterium]
VPALVTSMYETSVGLAAGLALAAALPELPYACGLGTASLLAADVVVLKVQPLGGVAAALAVADAAGVPALVTSMYETSVGLAAGLALAAALPVLPYACGLGTASLLAADVVVDPLLPVGGVLAVRRPVPDLALLARLAA